MHMKRLESGGNLSGEREDSCLLPLCMQKEKKSFFSSLTYGVPSYLHKTVDLVFITSPRGQDYSKEEARALNYCEVFNKECVSDKKKFHVHIQPKLIKTKIKNLT